MNEDLRHYIPTRLDDPGKFLFWPRDVAWFAIAIFLIGMATGHQFYGLVGGIVGGFAYSKFKTGKHPGMAVHLFYWFTGQPRPKSLPPAHYRELNG